MKENLKEHLKLICLKKLKKEYSCRAFDLIILSNSIVLLILFLVISLMKSFDYHLSINIFFNLIIYIEISEFLFQVHYALQAQHNIFL